MKKNNLLWYLYLTSGLFIFISSYFYLTSTSPFWEVAWRFATVFLFSIILISPQDTVENEFWQRFKIFRNRNRWSLLWRILSVNAILIQLYYINAWFSEEYSLFYLNWKTFLYQYLKTIFR